MRHVKIWMFAAILTISGLVLNACSNDDNGITDPTEQLQNGEWTGSGEGRSGSIIAKVLVKNSCGSVFGFHK